MGRLSDEVLGDLIARQSRVIIIADGNDKYLMEYTENILKILKELQEYRSICDSPEKLKLIDELYLERCEEINRLKAELAEYKKLEEQGLLLRLKAKIGDELYEIHKLTGNITPRTITNILICNSTDLTIFYRCNNYSIIDRAFGETVFLTKEEAEQALERMKGDS